MSLHIAKLFSRSVALASATLVIHVGAATAGDATADIQQQMRELLTGTTTAHSVAQSAAREGTSARPAVDTQALVRQVLLGTTGSRAGGADAAKGSEVTRASSEAAPQARPVTHVDTQAAVRQFLLGQPHTSDASYLAARPTR